MATLWPEKEANQIVKKHGKDLDEYTFETGFGASGKPHFGTFGEVVRTNFVMLALKEMGYPTHLISFSDDLDGLRKVPEGFPAWLKDYIGHPVANIPDPFETHDSFAAHMNALLVQMLEELELDFDFRSSAECYRLGTFNDQITTVIQNYERVQEIVFPSLREETQENWFPFFPICEGCGSIGHTRVTAVDKENLLLTYVCDREFGGVPGCGHQGQSSPLNGGGKLQWKVDWPVRWVAFGVNYEMFGKDLIESAEVGDRIVQRVFRERPPVHMFYELFLDEDGRKISKSRGQGITADIWQQYGTRDSLMLLMLDKPREAKRLYPGVIPRYMENSQKAAEAYYDGADNVNSRTYQYMRLFNPPAERPVLVDYTTLVNLVGNVGLSDPEIVEDYLRRSNLVQGELSEQQRSDLHAVILMARRYYDEQMSLSLEAPALDAEDGFLLGQLVTQLEAEDRDADYWQNQLFEIAKSNDVKPPKFFRALYSALIKQERGPRGGQFIKTLGQDTAANLIRQRIAEAVQQAEPAEDAPSVTMIPVAISDDVRKRFPAMKLGAALIHGVSVTDERPETLDAEIAAAVQHYTEFEAAREAGAIGAYRRFFSEFGTNPNAMPPSPENILRLAVHEDRLPYVNSLVDAINLTVLETGISVAAYDVDKLSPPLVLRLATADDKHQAIGARGFDSVTAGELVYADSEAVICRALNHRDADKTKITSKTSNVLLIVDGSPEIDIDDLVQALEANLRRLLQYAGGTVAAKTVLL